MVFLLFPSISIRYNKRDEVGTIFVVLGDLQSCNEIRRVVKEE